jgi:hypothetical protein
MVPSEKNQKKEIEKIPEEKPSDFNNQVLEIPFVYDGYSLDRDEIIKALKALINKLQYSTK